MALINYDLNVPVPLEEDLDETVKKVERLIRFGYSVIALNVSHSNSNKRKKPGKKSDSVQTEDDENNKITSCRRRLERISQNVNNMPKNFKILSRVTVLLDNPDHVRCLQTDFIQSFDIIAVRPTNEKLFLQACTQIENIDIISLDLDEKIPFRLKHSTVGAAVDRGICFELSYASCIRSTNLRQYVLANSLELIRKSHGKGIIFTSNAQHYMEIRGPQDIANLGLVFGLKNDQASKAIRTTCKDVVVHAYARAKTAKSVFCMRKTGEPSTDIETIVRNEIESTNTSDQVFHIEPTAKRAKKI